MADSIRQKIIDAVDAKLKKIKVVNGFETDIGNKVFHWKANSYEQANLPALEYRDVLCELIEGGPLQLHTFKLHFELEVITLGTTSITNVRKMIADIHKFMGQNIQWGGLAINTIPVSDEMKFEQTEKIIGSAIIRFYVLYRTKEFDPYN